MEWIKKSHKTGLGTAQDWHDIPQKARDGGRTCFQGPACDPVTNLTIDDSTANSTTLRSQITEDTEADSRVSQVCQITAKVESQTSHLRSSILYFSTCLLLLEADKMYKGPSEYFLLSGLNYFNLSYPAPSEITKPSKGYI